MCYFFSLLPAHRQKHVVVTCLTCGAVKRFLTQEKDQLWSERPENIVPPPPGELPVCMSTCIVMYSVARKILHDVGAEFYSM